MEMPYGYDSRILMESSNTFYGLFWEDAVSRILLHNTVRGNSVKRWEGEL